MDIGYPPSGPVLVALRTGDPQILAALEDAVRLWNTSVGSIIFEVVPKGTPGAVTVDKDADIQSTVEEAAATIPGIDVPVGGRLHVQGNAKGLRDPVTLAHELGHILGLAHPAPRSTYFHYIPTHVSTVAPIGLMGNGGRIVGPTPGLTIRPEWPKAPDLASRRDMGPSIGEVRYVRRNFDIIKEHVATIVKKQTPTLPQQLLNAGA